MLILNRAVRKKIERRKIKVQLLFRGTILLIALAGVLFLGITYKSQECIADSGTKNTLITECVVEKTATELEGIKAILSGVNKAMSELGYPRTSYSFWFYGKWPFYGDGRFDVVVSLNSYKNPVFPHVLPWCSLKDVALSIDYLTKGENKVEPYPGPSIKYYRPKEIVQSTETTPSFIERTVHDFVAEEMKEIQRLNEIERLKWQRLLEEYREKR